jgi:hypothetical protein
MRVRFFLIVCFFSTLMASAQEQYTISGSVKSLKTGETIIGANITTGDQQEGVQSNEYGFFSITLPTRAYDIHFSAIGYNEVIKKIVLNKNEFLNILLPEEVKSLDSVSVSATAKGRTIFGTQMGMERLTQKEIRTIPMLLGERDILKAIQLLPGIKPAGDGNSGFYVRGGSADQNLILLDEATVYNASHLMGFFSTFNSDAIKDITVYKGGMPAQYGGRLSSVLDVKMNDGNNKDFSVNGGVGLIAAKLNIEGPIQKDKSSFLVSARRTYADIFAKLSKDSSIKNDRLYFYDLNTKVNYSLGKRDKIFLSGYFGRDYLNLDKSFGIDWGNLTGTLRWNHIFSSRLFSNTSLIYSRFNYKIQINNINNDVNIFSQIRDVNLKQEFQWYAGQKHSLRFGFSSIYHDIKPGEVTSSGKTSFNNLYLQNRYSWENAIFLTDTWKAFPWLNLAYGVRISSLSIYGPGDFYTINESGNVIDTLRYTKGQLVKNYFNAEPRIATSFIINNSSSIKASYARNVQNMHLIANSSTSVPTDKWLSSTNIIKPEISNQYSLGWYKNMGGNNYELTTEVYYKTMQNQIDYRTGANVYTNDAIESQLVFGKGRAYGWEIMLKKNVGKLTGWINYTLSKSELKIDGINNNEWYNARQDRTHSINIVASYQWNQKWDFSANWVYYTGDAVTFPAGKYVIDNQIVFYYTNRNAFRLPAYHRLDLGATRKWQKPPHWIQNILPERLIEKWSSELAFGIYNAYGRQNAYYISFRQTDVPDNSTAPSNTEAVQTSLFRFVPYISYNFKF